MPLAAPQVPTASEMLLTHVWTDTCEQVNGDFPRRVVLCAEFYVTDSDGPLTDPKKIKTIEKVSRFARHTHRDLHLQSLISKLRDFCRCSTSIWKLMKPC